MARTIQTPQTRARLLQRRLLEGSPRGYRHEGRLQRASSGPPEALSWRWVLCAAAYARYKDEEPPHWDAQRWLLCARRRRAEREARAGGGGGGEPLAWVLVEDGRVPADAIRGGEAAGRPLYVCRAFHSYFGGGTTIQPGRVSQDGHASFGFGDVEHTPAVYEVLVGDERAVQWVTYSGAFDRDKRLGPRPVEAGDDRGMLPLYIAQADYDGDVLPGKCCAHLGGAWIPWAGKELHVLSPNTYRVLCYTPESDTWGTTEPLATPTPTPTESQTERAAGSRSSPGGSRYGPNETAARVKRLRTM